MESPQKENRKMVISPSSPVSVLDSTAPSWSPLLSPYFGECLMRGPGNEEDNLSGKPPKPSYGLAGLLQRLCPTITGHKHPPRVVSPGPQPDSSPMGITGLLVRTFPGLVSGKALTPVSLFRSPRSLPSSPVPYEESIFYMVTHSSVTSSTMATNDEPQALYEVEKGRHGRRDSNCP